MLRRSLFLAEDDDDGDDEDNDHHDDGDDAPCAKSGVLLRGDVVGDGPGSEDGELTGHAVDGDLVGAWDGLRGPEGDLLTGAAGDGDSLRLNGVTVDHEGDGLGAALLALVADIGGDGDLLVGQDLHGVDVEVGDAHLRGFFLVSVRRLGDGDDEGVGVGEAVAAVGVDGEGDAEGALTVEDVGGILLGGVHLAIAVEVPLPAVDDTSGRRC